MSIENLVEVKNLKEYFNINVGLFRFRESTGLRWPKK